MALSSYSRRAMHLLVKHPQQTETQREGQGRLKLDAGRGRTRGEAVVRRGQCTYSQRRSGMLEGGYTGGSKAAGGSRPELLLLRSKLETCHASLCSSCHLLALLCRLLLGSGQLWRLCGLSLLTPAHAPVALENMQICPGSHPSEDEEFFACFSQCVLTCLVALLCCSSM